MSPGRQAEVVEALVGHQYDIEYDACWSIEGPCGWRGGGPRGHAQHQLDALIAAGFELFRPIDVVAP